MPDQWSEAGLTEWAGENNIPTGIGGQAGVDGGSGVFFGANTSVEGQWLINFISGDLTYVWNTSASGRAGTPQSTVGAHLGMTFVSGATGNEEVIGAAQTGTLEVGTKGIWGGSATWARAYDFVDLNGNGQFDISGPNGFSEPFGVQITNGTFNRTVDLLAINAGVGIDLGIGNLVKRSGGVSYGMSDTNEIATFNIGDPVRFMIVDPIMNMVDVFQGE